MRPADHLAMRRRPARAGIWLAGIQTVALLAAGGCSGVVTRGDERLRVVTTTTDLRALVTAIGGERVDVESLLAGAQDPHHFETKPRHIASLRAADLLVRVGMGHEAWLPRVVAQAGSDRLHAGAPGDVDVAAAITDVLEPVAVTRAGSGHVHGRGNSHYWLDPVNGKAMARLITEALARAAPVHRAYFEVRHAAFAERLNSALARWRRALEPYRGMRVVAVHDSFPYLARRFGLSVVAHVEPQPGLPAPPAHLARLVGEMRARDVRVVLSESWLPQDAAERVVRDSGGTVVRLPTSVDSTPGTSDYVLLFDRITEILAAGLRQAGAPRPAAARP